MTRAGHCINLPCSTLRVKRNWDEYCLAMREAAGANGRAEIYICGTLRAIGYPKYLTKAIASLTSGYKASILSS